jgi:predicted enzyme related to lactoylglutathione lyase
MLHFDLVVSSTEDARSFYSREDIFPAWSSQPTGGRYVEDEEAESNPLNCIPFFHVLDVGKTKEEVQSQGGTIVEEGSNHPVVGGAYIVFDDPTGKTRVGAIKPSES